MKSNYIIFNTKNNHYLYSPNNNQILLLHPILHYILQLINDGVDLNSWTKTIKNKNIIQDIGIFSKKELLYYHKKFIFLSNNKYFVKNSNTQFRYNGENIKYYLSNTRNITFEVTERCNLSCDYCIYGKYYTIGKSHQNRDLNINFAKNTIDFLFNLWNSPLNSSYDSKISIGFYGGEALLNFEFIYEIVNYVKGLPFFNQNRIEFSMTTNGVLLNKYISFLVENDFFLRISMDGGTEKNNSYRKFPNKKSAFKIIYDNVEAIKNKYPAYFEKRVNFVTVLHNRNTYSEVINFFRSNFNKEPGVSELATDSLNSDFEKDFWKMHHSTPIISNDELKNAVSNIKTQYDINFDSLFRFIHAYSGYVKSNYSDLITNNKDKSYLQTGTCQPFIRMIFITSEGRILPCERIGHEYELGFVNDLDVSIDFNNIASSYNKHFENIYKKCKGCVHELKCTVCMFHTNIGSKEFNCTKFIKYSDNEKFFSSHIYELEKEPNLYLLTTKTKLV